MTAIPSSTKRDNLAHAAVILSIAGLLPLLPLVGSVAGLACGYAARRDEGGEGSARLAIILGWLGLAIPLVALFVYCVVLGYPFPIRRYRPDS